MKNEYKKILSFAKMVRDRLFVRDFFHVLTISVIVLSLLTLSLNIFFFILPLLFIPFVWDICLILFLGSVLFFALYYLVKRPSPEDSIRIIEKLSGIKHPVAAIALELGKCKSDFFIDRTVIEGVRQIAELEKYNPSVIKSRRCLYFMILSMVVAISTAFLPLSAVKYWYIPFADGKGLENIRIMPGTKTVPLNSKVTLSATFPKEMYPSCRLTIKEVDEGREKKYTVQSADGKTFLFTTDKLAGTISYRFTIGKMSSKYDTIYVQEAPSVYSIDISVISPGYTMNTAVKKIKEIGDFFAYAGSTIEMKIESVPLRKASLVLDNDTTYMTTDNNKAYISFVLKKDLSYGFVLEDTLGQKSDTLTKNYIRLIPDETPSVQFLFPAINKDLKESLKEDLTIEAADDFGIKSLYLLWKKSSEPDSVHKINLLTENRPKYFKKELIWDMTTYGLYPGDTVYYYSTVNDYYPYKPFHEMTSDTFWFRIPGFEEIHKRIMEKEARAESILADAVKRNEEMIEGVNKLQSAKKTGGEPDWEQRQKIEKINQDMKSQVDSLNEALRELGESAEQLQRQGILDESVNEKMKAIQKMVEELIKQYGDNIFPLPQNGKPLDIKDLKNAVEKAKEMLPDLKQDLENTLNYLEALKKDKMLAMLSMKAEELSSEQMQLTAQSDERMSKDLQSNLLNDIKALNKEVSDLIDKNDNEALDELLKKIDSMNKSMGSSVKKGAMPPKNEMLSMSSSLLSLSEKLKEMTNSSQQEKMEREKKIILGIAYDLLVLDEWVKNVSGLQNQKSSDQKQALLLQTIIDALRKINSHTDSLQVMPPQILKKIRKEMSVSEEQLKRALSSLGQFENDQIVNRASEEILTLVNYLLQLGSDEPQSSCNSQGQGMMSGLRKLSGKQAGINAVTSELLRRMMMGNKEGDMPGQSGMSASEKAEIEQARKEAQEEQKKIADELDRLQKENAGEINSEQIKKRIEELKKEAADIAKMLSGPKTEVVEKQNEFLNRMLQTTLSMNKREETEEERKSESAINVFSGDRMPYKPLSPSSPDKFFILKRRALQGVYPEKYRDGINAYFDSLEIIYLRDNVKK